jgi:ribosome-associated protein
MPEKINIPAEKLSFRVSRSSGPGGQHVNKTDTKVEAVLHIASADFLTEEQRAKIQDKLKTRINKEGQLCVVCQQTRSQLTNKEKAINKLKALLNKALEVEKPRKPTKIPKAVKEERIKVKRIRAEKLKGKTEWKKLL